MKLKYRLSLFFLAVIVLGAATSFVLIRRSTESVFRTYVFSGDSGKAEIYSALLSDYYQTRGNWSEAQNFLRDMPTIFSHTVDTTIHGDTFQSYSSEAMRTLMADRVVLADENGVIVADTAAQILGTVHPFKHIEHGIPVFSGPDRKGTVLVGSMIDSSLTGIAEGYLDSVTLSLALSSLVSVAVALILGFLFANRMTKPLVTLSKAAQSVASGDLTQFVPIRGDDEISSLSSLFNAMTSELKRLDSAKKQLIADSAHELRTPVTLIQGTLEGMIDGIFPLDIKTLESVHEETLRLSRLIETLRELEIIESGELKLVRGPVDIREMLEKAVSLFAAAAASKSISLKVAESVGESPAAFADYVRLGEVIYNLISNALRYTPDHGIIRVRGEPSVDGSIRFSVDDSGPGIPFSERAQIFERFYRIDKSRSSDSGGRGLGLAIASEIIKAHGGSIAVETSDLGGASFIVTLPALS